MTFSQDKSKANLCLFLAVSLVIHALLFVIWPSSREKITPTTSIFLELTPEMEEDLGQAPETPILPPVREVKQVKISREPLPKKPKAIPQKVKISPAVAEVKTSELLDQVAEASPEVPSLPSMPRAGKPSRKTFKTYFGQVLARISANKYYPFAARMAGQTGKVVVSFVIDTRGDVSQIEVEKPCRFEILNRAAVTTVKRAAPFPPPPRELNPPLRLTVAIKFEIK
ncbi:energy transducer TonB [Thermodesulfatator atlanticus]|uniref:energy transducer TonB n=1 Tax=Thermodesulfatator atlanticus TaxID=501497 RepID=UPI0003B59410|nr:TonB family protein [Thermodesulfatator atlanticus]